MPDENQKKHSKCVDDLERRLKSRQKIRYLALLKEHHLQVSEKKNLETDLIGIIVYDRFEVWEIYEVKTNAGRRKACSQLKERREFLECPWRIIRTFYYSGKNKELEEIFPNDPIYKESTGVKPYSAPEITVLKQDV